MSNDFSSSSGSRRSFVLGAAMAACVAGAFFAGLSGAPSATAQQGEPQRTAKTWAAGGQREVWTPDNAVFAFIDHQTGLMNIVDNDTPVSFKNFVLALGETAKLHNMPVVLTTSAETGPNGPLLPELIEMFPDAPLISRPGQINAWENADFVEAIRKTGRKKIIMSGITTDVCVTFAALSALDAGYEVYVVVDASGSMSDAVQTASLMRMQDAGAIMGNWFAISCELLWDWRNPTGPGTAELFVNRFQAYSNVFQSHKATQQSAR